MTRWIPDDQELDGVARELAVPTVDPSQIEQTRTSVLARATLGAPLATRSWSKWVVAGAALAAAAAVVLWLVAMPEGPKQVITALGPASYERAHDWPDFVVHLSDGRVEVRVAALASAERFRVMTGDAEVEVRGSSFEIRAEADRLREVLVQVGRAEVRVRDQQVVVLAAGERWTASAIARVEVIPPPMPAPATTPTSTPMPVHASVPPPAPAGPAKTTHEASAGSHAIATSPHTSAAASEVETPPAKTSPPPPPAPAPSAPSALPGELDFRAGWAALRANDTGTAAGKFETACTAALHTALGEDACFWAGAAAKRANDTAHARAALERFIASFPGSSRVGEASALLGWIRLDAGDASGATSAFHRAEQDRVPRVRDSAAKGLAALRGEH